VTSHGSGRFLARLSRSRTVAVIVSVLVIAGVAAGTTAVVLTISPNPTSSSAGAATGSPFGNHPVVITLPHQPASYLGAYVQGNPRSYGPLNTFAAAAGTQPSIAVYYSGWGEPFQDTFAVQAADHDAVPLVQIEPGGISLAALAAGAYDSYLESFADAVASYGARTGHGVIIGFAHEPNGSWYPWGYKHLSPATWVAAWRHIVDVFRRQGADDVTWLWTVNIIDLHGGIASPGPWWPGSSYVTWIGIDGYYYKPSWRFAPLFGPTIRAVRALSLDPILISETGVAPAAGKPAKIADLFAGIRSYGLLGFVWFDAKRHQDWRISSASAFAAYHHGAQAYKRPEL
jgi:hypothetical protein